MNFIICYYKELFMKLSVLLIFSVLLLSGCYFEKTIQREDENTMLTKEQIIDRANKSVISSNFFGLEDSTIFYDEGNKEWTKKFSRMEQESPDYTNSLKKLIGDRSYQAILYKIKADVLVIGSSHWLLIDTKTGEAICFIQDPSI